MITQTTTPARKFWLLFLFIPILLMLWVLRNPLTNLLGLLQDQQTISAQVRRLGLWGPLIFFVVMIMQVFVAIIPGQGLMMAGGYVFGPALAISLTSVSTIIGSQIAFLVARRWGRPIVYRLNKPELIQRWDKLSDRQGSIFFFFSFILPFMPSDVLCYVAGLGKVSQRGFLLANVTGRVLCAIIITLIGVYGFTPPWQFWVFAVVGMAGFYIAWDVYRNRTRLPRSQPELALALGMWFVNAYRRIFSIELRVRGLENLPPGPKILTANHPNITDAFLLVFLLGGRVRSLAQASQFRAPLIRWVLTQTGQIPVHAGRKHEAYEQACQALASGETLLVFPEGRLNPDNEQLRINTGAVRMSLASGAAIIPIGIHVQSRDTRCVSGPSAASGRKLFQVSGLFSVNIGQPWWPAAEASGECKPNEIHKLTGYLMERIHAARLRAAEECGNEDSYARTILSPHG